MGKWEFWVFFILIVVFPILQWITRTLGKLAKTPERRPSHRPPARLEPEWEPALRNWRNIGARRAWSRASRPNLPWHCSSLGLRGD